ncbi:putative signal transducing protein [Niabella drilacis]|uniref:Putative signal transducing protein n=1 Tax=Niabella drilacis (strain DSM 25811 / CCM 8410 / CCUG 62505 / LMG 26954 / E90) TaxID=1285928 RepID=A0A1G6HY48_NIADE|nr:DUF2007 domain-containing protein [Niabella drilacis]SDB99141.1 Putative signal transducing protein [Niabella drilacis]
MTDHTQDAIIVVRTYNDIAAAVSAKEKLEEAGITATIDDMDVVGITPLAGIEVKIFSKDLEKANQALAS